VEQARLAVRASKAGLAAATDALANARERLRLAEGRYQTGVGSIIELGDAQLAATNAGGQRVRAEYDLATARAQLLEALGRL
jgi:outer membrane protein